MSLDYRAPLRDMNFVIGEWLDAPSLWRTVPQWADLDLSTAQQVLDEAARFVHERIAPLNASGDLEGCRFDNGEVAMPPGFAAAYGEYMEAGWPTLALDADCGGQGLPQLLDVALQEMLAAANHAWLMSPGLTHGATACLQAHGSERVRRDFLPKVASGEWLTTMCLTEPQAGSDLGLLRTRAVPDVSGDGYRLSGTKIFITGGEHDMTENIVHLVLARLPDAPPGTKGFRSLSCRSGSIRPRAANATACCAKASKRRWGSRRAPPARWRSKTRWAGWWVSRIAGSLRCS